jgi:hypothetical protein
MSLFQFLAAQPTSQASRSRSRKLNQSINQWLCRSVFEKNIVGMRKQE